MTPKTGWPSDYQRVLDGVARTVALWRDLPEELGNWKSIYQQFRRWSLSVYGTCCSMRWWEAEPHPRRSR
jgi:transposase